RTAVPGHGIDGRVDLTGAMAAELWPELEASAEEIRGHGHGGGAVAAPCQWGHGHGIARGSDEAARVGRAEVRFVGVRGSAERTPLHRRARILCEVAVEDAGEISGCACAPLRFGRGLSGLAHRGEKLVV